MTVRVRRMNNDDVGPCLTDQSAVYHLSRGGIGMEDILRRSRSAKPRWVQIATAEVSHVQLCVLMRVDSHALPLETNN